jgi:hypothetical protein
MAVVEFSFIGFYGCHDNEDQGHNAHNPDKQYSNDGNKQNVKDGAVI